MLAASALVQVVGCFVCSRLLSDGGPSRRTTLLVSLVGMTLSNVAIAVSQSRLGDNGVNGDDAMGIAADALQVMGTLVYVGAWASGVGTVPWLVAVESFPQYARGAAVGAAAAAHWSYILDMSTGFRSFVAAFGAAAAFVGFALLTGAGVVLLIAGSRSSSSINGTKTKMTMMMMMTHWTRDLVVPEAGGVPLEDVRVVDLTNEGDTVAKPLLPRTMSMSRV